MANAQFPPLLSSCFHYFFSSMSIYALIAQALLLNSVRRAVLEKQLTAMQNAPDIKNRLVNFNVRDVYIPDPREMLMDLYGNIVLQGKVVDLTDSGINKNMYAVVEVEGVDYHVIVPVEYIVGVL